MAAALLAEHPVPGDVTALEATIAELLKSRSTSFPMMLDQAILSPGPLFIVLSLSDEGNPDGLFG